MQSITMQSYESIFRIKMNDRLTEGGSKYNGKNIQVTKEYMRMI